MWPACPPMASTQPTITSSTAAGSTSTRSNKPRKAGTPRSIGWTLANEPLCFPTGVRTASMMKASGISNSLYGLLGGYPAENDRKILAANLFGCQQAAGSIPTHPNPGSVADKPVHQVDVEIGPEIALLDPLLQNIDPHLPLSPVQLLDVGETRLRRQSLRLVLVDHHLRVPALDRVEGGHEQSLQALQRIWLRVNDVLIAGEQPVEEVAEHLVDHLFFGGEVVVQAA